MKNTETKAAKFLWADLTVNDAASLRDFYKEVAGWDYEPFTLKDNNEEYSDYIMTNTNGDAIAGICNKRGVNKEIPSQWIIYLGVDDVFEAKEKVILLGGEVIHENKKNDGTYNYILVRDPQGAVFGLGSTDN